MRSYLSHSSSSESSLMYYLMLFLNCCSLSLPRANFKLLTNAYRRSTGSEISARLVLLRAILSIWSSIAARSRLILLYSRSPATSLRLSLMAWLSFLQKISSSVKCGYFFRSQYCEAASRYGKAFEWPLVLFSFYFSTFSCSAFNVPKYTLANADFYINRSRKDKV